MATKRRKSDVGEGTDGIGVGEFRSGPIAGTALVDGATFRRRPVLWSEVDGLAVVEGDIVLGTVEQVRGAGDVGGAESLGISGSQFRWPGATVPFTIDSSLPNQSRVTDAVAHWEARTRIRLVPHDPSRHRNWVHFAPGGGCSSAVGMQGGQQTITLGSGCSTGNAIHEIGHALGLWHEQSREDRDTFVRVVFANIDPTKTHNFTQHITDGDDLGAYDYGSIMHYPPKAFSKNDQATIVALQPVPPGVVVGQRDGLSAGDVAGIHTLYPDVTLTLKEAVKDLAADPIGTTKEIAADPVLTRKEVLKEAVLEPVLPGGGFLPGPVPRSVPLPGQTFVTGAPSRAPAAALDPVAQLTARVVELGDALAAVQQQQAALAAAYDHVVALLAQVQGRG